MNRESITIKCKDEDNLKTYVHFSLPPPTKKKKEIRKTKWEREKEKEFSLQKDEQCNIITQAVDLKVRLKIPAELDVVSSGLISKIKEAAKEATPKPKSITKELVY